MQKEKSYRGIKFTPRLLRSAIDKAREVFGCTDERYTRGQVGIGHEKWMFDSLEEFLASYNHSATSGSLRMEWKSGELDLMQTPYESYVSIKSPHRKEIESISSVFDEAEPSETTNLSRTELTVFIGHGGSDQWVKLKSHLQDKHNLNVEAFETGARAGHTIRDIVESMATKSSFALLVLTGEDETKDNKKRARQNVIHETGLFQGRLGFDRAIMLVERGIELGSNFDGVQQIRFDKGRISETFGEILATIKREFGSV